jgi:hypothetical protein
VTFWKIGPKRYLAAGRHHSGYKIARDGNWWMLDRLENIENEASAICIGVFGRLNEAKGAAREHNEQQVASDFS